MTKPNAVATYDNLACPMDASPLSKQDKQLVCEQGHSFDIARRGYVNLLPVQHKRSKHPGDSKDMIIARKHFLSGGHYLPIAKNVASMLEKLHPEKSVLNILDAGCGEGFYLDFIFGHYSSIENNPHSFIGLDISKDAIMEAAKCNKSITWIVGTNRQLPVIPGTLDVIICMFGFPVYSEFSAALGPGGVLIQVDPGPDHLKELRAILYEQVLASEKSSGIAENYDVIESESLIFKTNELDNASINNLLKMTPHYYRAKKEKRELAEDLQALVLTVDVEIKVFKPARP